MDTLLRQSSVYRLNELKREIEEALSNLVQNRPSPARLSRIEFKISKSNLLSWLGKQALVPLVYWSDREGKLEFAGVGQAQVITPRKDLTQLDKSFRYFGGISFDSENLASEWKLFGPAWFILPRFEISWNGRESIFACHYQNTAADLKAALVELEDLNFDDTAGSDKIPGPISRSDQPSQKGWIKALEIILKSIHEKHLEKVVLARKSEFEFLNDLSPWDVLTALKPLTKNCFHFCLQPDKTAAFLGASPERLYAREKRQIKTEAIAGTRPRGENPQEDARLKKMLFDSAKDQREHNMVTEFLFRELSVLCSYFKMGKTSLLSLEDSQHLLSMGEGMLNEGITDANLLAVLHPTPAVGGCPTEKSLEMIRKLEPFSRGWYAGSIGWVKGEEAEFSVAIRSALVQNKKLALYAGAGIIEDSDPISEWNETEYKLGSFLKILKYGS